MTDLFGNVKRINIRLFYLLARCDYILNPPRNQRYLPWPLKAKLACQPARCLLPVEIIEKCGLSTGPTTVDLLT